MMTCCFLLAHGRCFTASHAVQYLNGKLQTDIEYFPSQLRYVYISLVVLLQVVRQRFIAAQIGYQEIKLKQPPTPQMIKLDKIYMYTIPVFDKKGSCGTSRCSAASRSLSQRVHLLEWQSPSSPFAEAASRSSRPNLWHVFWKTLPLFFFHNRQHNKRMCTSAKRSYLLKQLKNKKKKN
jgi:hypothetical protein